MSELIQKAKDWLDKIKADHFSYSRRGIRPVHDWNVILIITSITICILAAISFYFYREVDQGKIFAVERDDSQKEVRIKNDLLEKVVGDINLREEIRNNIKSGKLTKPDPSL